MEGQWKERNTNDNTILADLDVVADGGGLDDGARADMNVVADLHGVVVEVATIGLVRWSLGGSTCEMQRRLRPTS